MDNSERAVFDASQYDFFGADVVEEVELGGLDDEEEGLPLGGIDEEDFLFDREEGDVIGSLLDVDELSSTFSKLNKDVSGLRGANFTDDQGSREDSSDAQWRLEENIPKWFDQRTCYTEGNQEGKWWSSRPSASPDLSESRPLNRASYPEQQEQQLRDNHQLEFFSRSVIDSNPPCTLSSFAEQQQQMQLQHQLSSEPIPVPESSLLSYPPAGGYSSLVSHHSDRMTPSTVGGKQMAISSSNHSPASSSQLQFIDLHHGSQFGENIPDFLSGPSVNIQQSKEWVNQPVLYSGDNYGILNNFSQHQLSHQNCIRHPTIVQKPWPQQTQHHFPVMPSFGHLSGVQSGMPHPSASISNMSLEARYGMANMQEQRLMPPQRFGQNVYVPQQSSYTQSQGRHYRLPRFWSKYMTVNDLEIILRAQLSSTHSNDLYIDDYYHQGCLAKKSVETKLKHYFYPTHLRDLPSEARANSEPHAFLQVNALGRVALSSIHRPRPILDICPQDSSGDETSEISISEKPLKKDPIIAVRRRIEDGFCIALDIDDTDRFLKFIQFQDRGYQLRQKRQDLLEKLAASLRLDGSQNKNGRTDEHLFLQIICLSKGKRLIARYLQLLQPGDKLLKIVSMAIFSHLQFLFGSLPFDPEASKATNNLARVVSSCVEGMDLEALSACLAAVVHSLEQPPLRPLGSLAGDGASLIIKSVLERATVLLTDPDVASHYSMTTRSLWQTSFDAFFNLLTDYCVKKYDSIIQSFLAHALPGAAVIGSDAARAITKEMPIELLRASLPHTDEQQRRTLLEFAHRSMPMVG